MHQEKQCCCLSENEMEWMNLKSISNRLMVFISVVILVLCLGLGFAAYQGSTAALLSQTDELLQEIAETAAAEATLALDKQLTSLEPWPPAILYCKIHRPLWRINWRF